MTEEHLSPNSQTFNPSPVSQTSDDRTRTDLNDKRTPEPFPLSPIVVTVIWRGGWVCVPEAKTPHDNNLDLGVQEEILIL